MSNTFLNSEHASWIEQLCFLSPNELINHRGKHNALNRTGQRQHELCVEMREARVSHIYFVLIFRI